MVALCLFPVICWVKVCSDCFKQVFFHFGDKKVVAGCVRQVVVLYSNNCMGICLGRLSAGRLRLVIEVVVENVAKAT